MKFIMQTIASAIITMVFIYFIKKVTTRYDVPVLKQIAEGV